MPKTILLIIISFLCVQLCQGQNILSQAITQADQYERSISLPALQTQLKKVIRKVTPACVQVITHEPLGGSPTGMGASGVCISMDGIIMTAGHMVIPNGKYEIQFPDGRKVTATGLGKIGKLDAGLLKITTAESYPFVEMGYSSGAKKGEVCFSISYPGSFRNRMVTRIGYIEKISSDLEGDVRTNFILNTCLMEPGDSGGPLFDMNGRVIGTRSYIGQTIDENYDVPVDVFRGFWSALQQPVSYTSVPEEDTNSIKLSDNSGKTIFWQDMIKGTRNHFNNEHSSSIKVTSGSNSITGTLVNFDGMTSKPSLSNRVFIISKSSEVGENPVIEIDGKNLPANIIFRDNHVDLVLLEVAYKKIKALSIAKFVNESIDTPFTGRILISYKRNDNFVISIQGTEPFDLPGYYYSGYLGLRLELQGESNVVTSVQPGTAAALAQIRVGDIIISINNVAIKNPSQFISELQNKKPGDTIVLIRNRGEIMDTLNVILQPRPFRGINHISEQFPGGRSDRRDGFETVFIHSADIRPSDCGGPVFDINGKLAGINIARYSRVGTLTIPAYEVMKFLREAVKIKL